MKITTRFTSALNEIRTTVTEFDGDLRTVAKALFEAIRDKESIEHNISDLEYEELEDYILNFFEIEDFDGNEVYGIKVWIS